jgi:hypothetical protein
MNKLRKHEGGGCLGLWELGVARLVAMNDERGVSERVQRVYEAINKLRKHSQSIEKAKTGARGLPWTLVEKMRFLG